MHLHHGGNIGPKSTQVVQKDEISNAFWPEPCTAGPYIPGDFMMLRSDPGSAFANKWPMIQLDGDLDLFNDRSAVVKRWVGHTPGSQMMIVRLPKTGTVILTSDNAYFAENVTKNLISDVSLAYNPTGILNGYRGIR
jgi:N-acyl homoserine lactone hydrolase